MLPICVSHPRLISGLKWSISSTVALNNLAWKKKKNVKNKEKIIHVNKEHESQRRENYVYRMQTCKDQSFIRGDMKEGD